MIAGDFRETLRALRRRPGPALAAIVALAFAIGLFAAIMSLLQGARSNSMSIGCRPSTCTFT